MIASQHRKQKQDTDPRGKIKSGEKGLSSSGKEIPKALDHFNVDAFPELIALYGEKPKELLIAVGSDNIPDVFDDRLALYGSNHQAIRKCDGDTCIHRIPEMLGGKQYQVGEENECVCLANGLFDTDDKELKKKVCRYTMNLKAFVLKPNDGTVFTTQPILFETGSKNSGSAVYSALSNLAGLTTMILGEVKLAYIPMKLGVKMVSGKENATLKFPIWTLTPPTSISEIIERLRAVGRALGYDEKLMLRMDKSLLLEEGNPEAIPIPENAGEIILKQLSRVSVRSDMQGIRNQIMELPDGEQKSTLMKRYMARWTELKFDQRAEEKFDPNNPLGLE